MLYLKRNTIIHFFGCLPAGRQGSRNTEDRSCIRLRTSGLQSYKTLIHFFFCFVAVTQNVFAQDSEKINFTDENDFKQGHWIFTNAERQLPEYRDDQLVEEGYYKDNQKVGVWKKYYENGSLEYELTFVNNRPSGYAIFYYKNGKISEEGVWKNNRWVGEYKYYHENGKLKYEWKYDVNGKRSGEQKYYYENGQLMIIGDWKEGKESGELKEYYSNGDIRAVKFYNNGAILPDSTKKFPKPEGISDNEEVIREDQEESKKGDTAPVSQFKSDTAIISVKDTITVKHAIALSNEQPIGFFDGNGYCKLLDKNGRVSREGEFKKGFLVNGKLYRYNAEGGLDKTIIYKEGKVVEEIINK